MWKIGIIKHYFSTEKKPHIKKPLNAFMLYMKEMRAKVVAECTLKESAAINQILGRKVGCCFIVHVFFSNNFLIFWIFCFNLIFVISGAINF